MGSMSSLISQFQPFSVKIFPLSEDIPLYTQRVKQYMNLHRHIYSIKVKLYFAIMFALFRELCKYPY